MNNALPTAATHTTRADATAAAAPAAVTVEFSPCRRIATVILNRPHCRNAVDGATARALHRAMVECEVSVNEN